MSFNLCNVHMQLKISCETQKQNQGSRSRMKEHTNQVVLSIFYSVTVKKILTILNASAGCCGQNVFYLCAFQRKWSHGSTEQKKLRTGKTAFFSAKVKHN